MIKTDFFKYKELNLKFSSRVNFILNIIYETFNYKLDDWHILNFDDENIYIYPEPLQDIDFMSNTKECFYFIEEPKFPTRWLFEDFEDELKIGKKIMEDNVKSQDNDKNMLEAIKYKLSEKEFRILTREFKNQP